MSKVSNAIAIEPGYCSLGSTRSAHVARSVVVARAACGRYNAIPGSVERFGGIGVCVRAGMLVPLPVRTGEKSSQTRFFFEIPGCLTEKIARSAARAA
eukprot:COSAG02_NODE_13326_length_1409_cov_452.439695_1_plen_97_part_10